MPTDPFVPAPAAATPRHKQSLPVGIAVPPARSWTGGRPGDVTPDEAKGGLSGRPSPNGGFALTLVHRQRDSWTLGAHEYIGDAGAVVAEVAMKRASQFGRAPIKGDVDLAVALLGYDGTADAAFVTWRSGLVHEAAHHYLPRRAAVDLVDDELLRRNAADIRTQAPAWRAGVVTAH